MNNDLIEAAGAFEDVMDDTGLMPGDEGFTGEEIEGAEDLAERFEEDLEEEEAGDGAEEAEETEDEASDETDEDEGDGEEDEGEPSGISDDSLIDITIDGEEYEVNFHELKAGYLRNEDYVKRSTELETEHSTRMAELSQKEAELIREIEATAVIATADLSRYENRDWAKLKAEDPAKYAEEFSEFMEKRQAIQAQITRRNAVQQLHQKAEQLKHEAFLKEQLGLARKLIPEFDDNDYRERVFKYAESIGITKDEVASIADARHLLLLGQAMKFQESQVKRKGVVQKKVTDKNLPPVVKPTARKPTGDSATKRQKGLEARLAQTGDLRHAAEALEAFI